MQLEHQSAHIDRLVGHGFGPHVSTCQTRRHKQGFIGRGGGVKAIQKVDIISKFWTYESLAARTIMYASTCISKGRAHSVFQGRASYEGGRAG